MRVIDLVLKDLSQLLRDWKSALFLVIMPVAFTLMFSFAFGSAGEPEDARLPVGYLDLDGGSIFSLHLLSLLEASDSTRPVILADTTEQDAADQVVDGSLAAVVIVPEGYGQGLLETGDATAFKPKVLLVEESVTGSTAQSGIQAVVVRLASSVQAARQSVQALENQGQTVDDAILESALAQAIEAWQDPPLTVELGQSGDAVQEEISAAGSAYAHSSAGIMVQFAIAGLIGAATIIVLERKSGAMRRLLTTPISRFEIILGHFLAMFVMVLLQLVILVLFGQLALGVGYMRVPLATILMVVVTALWAASLGLLIGVLSRSDEQVLIFCLVAMMVLSGLGGAWIPLEFTSEAFQTVGRLMPTAWAIEGFENIVMRGLGLESIWLPVVLLLGLTAVLFALAAWRFRFE